MKDRPAARMAHVIPGIVASASRRGPGSFTQYTHSPAALRADQRLDLKSLESGSRTGHAPRDRSAIGAAVPHSTPQRDVSFLRHRHGRGGPAMVRLAGRPLMPMSVRSQPRSSRLPAAGGDGFWRGMTSRTASRSSEIFKCSVHLGTSRNHASRSRGLGPCRRRRGGWLRTGVWWSSAVTSIPSPVRSGSLDATSGTNSDGRCPIRRV